MFFKKLQVVKNSVRGPSSRGKDTNCIYTTQRNLSAAANTLTADRRQRQAKGSQVFGIFMLTKLPTDDSSPELLNSSSLASSSSSLWRVKRSTCFSAPRRMSGNSEGLCLRVEEGGFDALTLRSAGRARIDIIISSRSDRR